MDSAWGASGEMDCNNKGALSPELIFERKLDSPMVERLAGGDHRRNDGIYRRGESPMHTFTVIADVNYDAAYGQQWR